MDSAKKKSESPASEPSRNRRCTSLTSPPVRVHSSFPIIDEERPKTRRVNPQRLALRLGPDLVAEMEALIVPGAKMPTFAVRKDFQERYCVDRRHIYDYFHSRGLRVAKEDKHTNLKRGRTIKAERAQQSAALAPDSHSKEHSPRHAFPKVSSHTCQDLPHARVPKRAATYPSIRPSGRNKWAALKRSVSPGQGPVAPTPLSPTRLWALASPVWDMPPELTSSASGETADAYWLSDDNETAAVGHSNQLPDVGSLSMIEDFQEHKPEDFTAPLGTSWALDQCNSLYDLLDGDYPYLHDTALAVSYRLHDTFAYFPGHGFSDIHTHVSGENAQTLGFYEDSKFSAGPADRSTQAGSSLDTTANE